MSLQCVATGPNATQRKQSVIEPPGAPALGPVGSHWAPFTAKTRPNAPVVGRPGEGALNTLSWASVSHPHEVIRAVRALPALRADPIGPLHGHKVAVVRHAHDAAVDGVRRLTSRDHLTDFEVIYGRIH